MPSGEGDTAGREGSVFLEQGEFGPLLQGWVLRFSLLHPLLGGQGERGHVPAHGLASRELRSPSNSEAAAKCAGAVLRAGHVGVLGAGHLGVHPSSIHASHPQSLWQHQNSPDGILSLHLQDPHTVPSCSPGSRQRCLDGANPGL